jgi:DNA-binding NarL/FixJ family response regulator
VATVPKPESVILVVSDDARVGRALVSYLSTAAASLSVAGPLGCGALRDAATLHPAVVVCDLDGCNLTAAFALIEQLVRSHNPSVVALSSRAGIRRLALDHGATTAADKSDDVDQLAAIIQEATSMAR